MTFVGNGFPLVVEAWVAFDDGGLGEKVCASIADGVETLNWVRDVGRVFVVLQHMCLDPNMAVCFGEGPGSSAVDPDAKVLGGMEVACIEAISKRALVVLHDGLTVTVKRAR